MVHLVAPSVVAFVIVSFKDRFWILFQQFYASM